MIGSFKFTSYIFRTLLDIQVSELNIRVSYNDVMLFLNIFQSITGKTKLEGKIRLVSRPVSSVAKRTREVWGSITGAVKSAQCR